MFIFGSQISSNFPWLFQIHIPFSMPLIRLLAKGTRCSGRQNFCNSFNNIFTMKWRCNNLFSPYKCSKFCIFTLSCQTISWFFPRTLQNWCRDHSKMKPDFYFLSDWCILSVLYSEFVYQVTRFKKNITERARNAISN